MSLIDLEDEDWVVESKDDFVRLGVRRVSSGGKEMRLTYQNMCEYCISNGLEILPKPNISVDEKGHVVASGRNNRGQMAVVDGADIFKKARDEGMCDAYIAWLLVNPFAEE